LYDQASFGGTGRHSDRVFIPGTVILEHVGKVSPPVATTGKFEQPRVRLFAATFGVALFVFAFV